jgi:hypothetical protein
MTKPTLSELPMTKRYLLSSAALIAIAAPIALGLTGTTGVALATTNAVETKHYRNDEWKFELDIPEQWVVMPPDPTNGPEVIRFVSQENGYHNVIVWRSPNYPKYTPETYSSAGVQHVLAKGGFSNFVSGETRIGSRRVLTLDFSRTNPDGSVWSCRHYFVVGGKLLYVLGFGTNSRDSMIGTFDRMAKTFVFEEL